MIFSLRKIWASRHSTHFFEKISQHFGKSSENMGNHFPIQEEGTYVRLKQLRYKISASVLVLGDSASLYPRAFNQNPDGAIQNQCLVYFELTDHILGRSGELHVPTRSSGGAFFRRTRDR